MHQVHNATTARLEALAAQHEAGYDAHFSQTHADDTREVYAAELEHLREVTRTQHEGVFEITLRTRTRTVVVPVSVGTGTEIVGLLQEELGNKLHRLENEILYYLRNAEDETEDAQGSSERAQVYALCMPQPAAIATPAPMPGQATATPPRLRAARAHRDAEATA